MLPPTTGYYRKAVTHWICIPVPSIMRAQPVLHDTVAAGARHPGVVTGRPCKDAPCRRPTFRGCCPRCGPPAGARKQTKREMAQETDPTQALLDKKQQAQKSPPTCVRVYRSREGMYACAEVARTVTAYGRDYIARTRQRCTTAGV